MENEVEAGPNISPRTKGYIGDLMKGSSGNENSDEPNIGSGNGERSRSYVGNVKADSQMGYAGPDHGRTKLECRERVYEAFFEQMRDGAVALSLDGTIILSNSSMARALGRTTEELNGKNIIDLVDSEGRQDLRDCLEEAGSASFDLKLSFLTGNRLKVTMLASLNVIEGPKGAIICMTAIDLQETKGAEAVPKHDHDTTEDRVEMREGVLAAADLMETVLMQLPAGVAIIDHTGKPVLINNKMNNMLGELTPAIENEDPGIFREQKMMTLKKMIGAISTPYVDGRSEIEYARPEGTRGHLSIRSTPVREAAGKPDGRAFMVLDVSKTAEMQKERQELMEKLRRSNEELQQFVSVASHDLKEPLRMVSSYVALIKRRYQGKLDADGNEFIDYAMDGAKRMEFLIDDLLRYTRLDTKNEPFRQVDVNEVMESVLRDLDGQIRSAGAIIEYDGLPTVTGDRSQINQLLENLISNAIKFRGSTRPRVEISAREERSYYLFQVKDNGVGVPEGCQERIFQMFQRAHKGMDYEGTGIGLAICKKILDRHGGKIWVESDGKNGSTFFFTIPVDPDRF
jgi:PAS domain S-box-containing protein